MLSPWLYVSFDMCAGFIWKCFGSGQRGGRICRGGFYEETPEAVSVPDRASVGHSKLHPCDGDCGSVITHSREGKFCMQQQPEERSENM